MYFVFTLHIVMCLDCWHWRSSIPSHRSQLVDDKM